MEIAQRHGIPKRLTEAELGEILDNPPASLVELREPTGKDPVWVHLECAVCGYEEAAGPKKWWPEFTYVGANIIPPRGAHASDGFIRSEFRRGRVPICGYR